MPFDARAAKLLPAGSHITIDECPGLRLKATNSTKTWLYRFKSPVDGKMRQIKIGAWPDTSFAKAQVEWEDFKRVRDSGVDPAKEKRSARSAEVAAERMKKASTGPRRLTVFKACMFYWEGHVQRNRTDKGATEVKRMFEKMLGDLADVSAVDLTRAQAFDLLDSFSDIPVQAAKLRCELGAAWDYNLDAGRLPEITPNWWRLIMRGRFKSKGKRIEGANVGTAKRFLKEDELAVLIPWLPNFSRNICDALTMYLWTCTRGSEIVSIHVDEITEEADGLWWTIPKEKTKNRKRVDATDLRVPLVGRAAAVVRRRMQNPGPDGHLFYSQVSGTHIEQKVIQTGVHYHQPYSKTRPEMNRPRLTVTKWAPHDLRRSSRTLLASIGCPEPVAEALLGHMQPGVKGIYNRHSYDKERREWLTALDARLEEIARRV